MRNWLENCLLSCPVRGPSLAVRLDIHQSQYPAICPSFRERGGSVVECRTPEREVRGSRPTVAVLCPWARHFTPRKYWLITQEAMAPSRYDWKIVDWDVKPQHNQPTIFQSISSMHASLLPSIYLFSYPSMCPFVHPSMKRPCGQVVTLLTSDHMVLGSNPTGGMIISEPKRCFMAQSPSWSPSVILI